MKSFIAILLSLMLFITPSFAETAVPSTFNPSPSLVCLIQETEHVINDMTDYVWYEDVGSVTLNLEYFAQFYNVIDVLPIYLNECPDGERTILHIAAFGENTVFLLIDYAGRPAGYITVIPLGDGSYSIVFDYLTEDTGWFLILAIGV